MQEAEQKTMLEHEKLKISELAEQVEQERVAAENAKATAEAEITDELKKARKILGCASRFRACHCCASSLSVLRRYKPTDKAKMKKTSSRAKSKRAKGAGGQGKSSGDDDSASTSTQG